MNTSIPFNPNRRFRRYFVVELRPVDVDKLLREGVAYAEDVREVTEEDFNKGKKVYR
jgi:hypothetical protein